MGLTAKLPSSSAFRSHPVSRSKLGHLNAARGSSKKTPQAGCKTDNVVKHLRHIRTKTKNELHPMNHEHLNIGHLLSQGIYDKNSFSIST